VVRNTGSRPGKQVVQVYLARPESSVERPVRWLAGFTTVRANPNETVEVTVPIGLSTFRNWDVTTGAWTVEPGTFEVLVGFSATAIEGTTKLEV
jgi:beta-glucosidase